MFLRYISKLSQDLLLVRDALSDRRIGNSGRKPVEVDLSKLTEIHLTQCMTLRSLSHSLQAKATTVWRLMKRGEIRRHSNAIKPILKEEHKKAHLEFCLSMLDQNTLSNEPKKLAFINV